MAIQKLITFNRLDINGKILDDKCELKLDIIEKSGNYLIHKDILRHNFNKKQGTVSTKTRSEVKGGGRKPWRQKGTGRARAGSNRSPLWKGGGIIFGPKPKIMTLKLNQKERKLAFQTLLYNKRNLILVLDSLENTVNLPKTKVFSNLCYNSKVSLNHKVLVVVSKKTLPLQLSTRNIPNVELISASNLNTFSLLKAKQIILTPQAISTIKEIYCD